MRLRNSNSCATSLCNRTHLFTQLRLAMRVSVFCAQKENAKREGRHATRTDPRFLIGGMVQTEKLEITLTSFFTSLRPFALLVICVCSVKHAHFSPFLLGAKWALRVSPSSGSMHFSGNFKGKTPISSKFWAQGYPWGPNSAAP